MNLLNLLATCSIEFEFIYGLFYSLCVCVWLPCLIFFIILLYKASIEKEKEMILTVFHLIPLGSETPYFDWSAGTEMLAANRFLPPYF